MMRNLLFLLAFCALFACSESPTKEPLTSEASEKSSSVLSGMTELDLSPYTSFTAMMVPDKSRSGVDASVEVDEASGFVHIHAGKKFRITLRQEPTTLEDIKQELAHDLMWNNEVSGSDEHSIIIKKTLPDGSMEQFHFATVLPGVGSNVVLKSDPMGEFTLKDVERMIYCAQSLKTSDGLALTQ